MDARPQRRREGGGRGRRLAAERTAVLGTVVGTVCATRDRGGVGVEGGRGHGVGGDAGGRGGAVMGLERPMLREKFRERGAGAGSTKKVWERESGMRRGCLDISGACTFGGQEQEMSAFGLEIGRTESTDSYIFLFIGRLGDGWRARKVRGCLFFLIAQTGRVGRAADRERGGGGLEATWPRERRFWYTAIKIKWLDTDRDPATRTDV